MDDIGLFVASGRVIASDPRKVVLDNQLGEDHVSVSILYCLNNISTVMTIWKWPLAQTIVDGYSLKQLVSNDENNIPTVDEEGVIGVRKKQYTFQKRKRSVGDYNQLVSKINKMLSQSLFGM